ncbi:MAG: UPF0280 family protein [Bacillota bacterium]
MYEERSYREKFKAEGLSFYDICIMETDLRIGARRNITKEALLLVSEYRTQLEDYIKIHPDFLKSLEPVKAVHNAPEIVKRMCSSAEKAGVGPMAAVAGAISEMVGVELLKYTDEVIVENGGDIYIKSASSRIIGIYAGSSPLSNRIGIWADAPEGIGICTSSGTVGHSLSFGNADAAVIISRDTFLADAAATALGNMIKSAADIESSLKRICSIVGIKGAVVIIGDNIGCSGDIQLVKI